MIKHLMLGNLNKYYFSKTMLNKIQSIPVVTLDPQGIFKYIQIKCTQGSNTHYFIRGSKNYEYHSQNFDAFAQELKTLGFPEVKLKMNVISTKCSQDRKQQFKVVGGGRVKVENGKYFVYGYSQSYGRCDHQITKQQIHKHLNIDLNNITWSDQGY